MYEIKQIKLSNLNEITQKVKNRKKTDKKLPKN